MSSAHFAVLLPYSAADRAHSHPKPPGKVALRRKYGTWRQSTLRNGRERGPVRSTISGNPYCHGDDNMEMIGQFINRCLVLIAPKFLVNGV